MKTTLIVGVGIAVLGLLLAWNRIFPSSPAVLVTDPNQLPGIVTTTGSWNPEIAHLRARLKDIGLPALAQEGSVLHIHQHLDLLINGSTVPIPAGIGIDEAGGFLSPIHTHDQSDIIHVESNVTRDFTLGEFFDIWGVRFTKDSIGGYTASATTTLAVYANGSLVTGDPRNLVLTEHQEIMIVYGAASSTPNVISSYSFAPGY